MSKHLTPNASVEITALEFHIRYGPRHFRTAGTDSYIVPVMPQYHNMLFPESDHQLSLLPGRTTFGNSIRKAYLCRAPIKKISPGANLFFYRSHDYKAATVVGVAEGCIRSFDAVEIARYVGKRTVYSFNEIKTMCALGEVLAILFRQAGAFSKPVGLSDLVNASILKAAPQSIMCLMESKAEWLTKQSKPLR